MDGSGGYSLEGFKMKSGIPLPKIVSQTEWQAAHEQLLAKDSTLELST